jgi:hypothetical protein
MGVTIAVALGSALLVGCAAGRSIQQTVSGWLGKEATPRAHYVGVARARLHREPEASSEVVGELALHEGVLSYRLENGFAYVRAERSGRSGWMRASDLIDQLPPPRPRPAAVETSPAPEPEAPSAEAAPPAEPPAEPEPAPEPPEKSVFDPY